MAHCKFNKEWEMLSELQSQTTCKPTLAAELMS